MHFELDKSEALKGANVLYALKSRKWLRKENKFLRYIPRTTNEYEMHEMTVLIAQCAMHCTTRNFSLMRDHLAIRLPP